MSDVGGGDEDDGVVVVAVDLSENGRKNKTFFITDRMLRVPLADNLNLTLRPPLKCCIHFFLVMYSNMESESQYSYYIY